MLFRRVIISLCCLAAFVAGAGKSYAASGEKTIKFKIESSRIENDFQENAYVINLLKETLEKGDPSQIRILAAASPDGPAAINARLARERGEAAVKLLKSIRPSLADSLFKVTIIDEDLEGAAVEVGKSGKAWAGEAMRILRGGGENPEEALRHMDDGRVWKYLATWVFPMLRRAEVELVYPEAVSPEYGIPDDSGISSEIRDSQGGKENGIISGESSGDSPGDSPDGNNGGKGKDNDKSDDAMPGWGWGLVGVLGAGVVALGGLFIKEKKNNRDLAQSMTLNNTPIVVPPVIPPEAPAPKEDDTPEPPSPGDSPEADPVVTTQSSPEVIPAAPVIPPVAPAADSNFLESVNALIAEKIGDPAFGVDALAAAMGISRIHLNRKLKTEAGTSPSVLLKNARMKMASELLTSGSMSISDISEKCGFSSPAYFSAAFKEYYGQTPRDFLRGNS